MQNLNITRNTKPDKILITKRNLRAFGRELERLWLKSLEFNNSTFHISDWLLDKLLN